MSQQLQILAHLKRGRTLTPLEALDKFGCFRLSARIHDLRMQGHPVEVTMKRVKSGKRVAEYRLAQ